MQVLGRRIGGAQDEKEVRRGGSVLGEGWRGREWR
jgi:hypothetical protein